VVLEHSFRVSVHIKSVSYSVNKLPPVGFSLKFK
jgi:hypothetical protein